MTRNVILTTDQRDSFRVQLGAQDVKLLAEFTEHEILLAHYVPVYVMLPVCSSTQAGRAAKMLSLLRFSGRSFRISLFGAWLERLEQSRLTAWNSPPMSRLSHLTYLPLAFLGSWTQ